MVDKLLTQKAAALLEKCPILTVTGPRQSGKTTFCRLLRSDYTYLNMKLPDNRRFAEQDLNGYLETYRGA